jgi:signal transduction histidine kinase
MSTFTRTFFTVPGGTIDALSMRTRPFSAFLRTLPILWIGVLLCLLLPGVGWTKDYILEKATWTDPTASASFEHARTAHYTPYANLLSKGYSPATQWVRLKIAASSAADSNSLVLRIRPIYLDEISLFDPADPSSHPQPRTTGDWTPWQSSEFESLNHTFLIPAQAQERYVWLRLSTTSTQLLQVEALAPRDMLREEQRLWLFYSVLLGLIFAFLVWVFLAWLRDRDPVNGMFVLRQTVLLAYTASYLGYHRLLLADVLEPRSQDILYNWLVLLTTALSLAFEYRFLREFVLPRWAHGVLRGLLFASAVAMSIMLWGDTRTALKANMLINTTCLLSFVAVSLRLRPHHAEPSAQTSYQLPKTVVVGYYLSIVMVLAMSILPSLGILAGTMLAVYGVLLYGLISGLFMTTLLIVRTRQMDQIRQDVANHLFLSQEQLAIEKKRRQDQTQLLSMLMHEIKTPLSIIDMAVSTRNNDTRTASYVTRAVDNIKGVLDRCIQTDRMVEHEFKLQSQSVNLSQQLLEWVNDRKEGPERFKLQVENRCLLMTDLQCLQIIVNNLLDNAFKHGAPQTPVQLDLSTSPHLDGRAGLLLTIANGPGPSGWPDPSHLFLKYYRSGGAQKVSGTGLGLYLAHNLAALLQGEIRYLPDPSNIRFLVWLPT